MPSRPETTSETRPCAGRRAAELREALTPWEAQGQAASLVTITVRHDLTDRLSKLLDAERAAWKRVTQGATWQRLKRRLGIAGHIIALEFTWGDENGWHPHYHVLLVHDQDLGAAAIAALHEYKRATRSLAAVRWSRGLRAMMARSATEPERSDEELAAADIGGNLIVVIQCPVWSRARTAGLEHAVLVAAEDGGLEAVNALISKAISGEAYLAPTLSGCTIE